MMELIDLIMGHRLYEFDCDHVFVNCNASDKRYRTLTRKVDVIAPEMVTNENWFDDYYRKRHDNLDQFSLYNLMMNFDVVAAPKKGGIFSNPSAKPKENTKINDYQFAVDDGVTITPSQQPQQDDDVDDNTDNDDDNNDEANKSKSIAGNPFQGDYNIGNKKSPMYAHGNARQSFPIKEGIIFYFLLIPNYVVIFIISKKICNFFY